MSAGGRAGAKQIIVDQAVTVVVDPIADFLRDCGLNDRGEGDLKAGQIVGEVGLMSSTGLSEVIEESASGRFFSETDHIGFHRRIEFQKLGGGGGDLRMRDADFFAVRQENDKIISAAALGIGLHG